MTNTAFQDEFLNFVHHASFLLIFLPRFTLSALTYHVDIGDATAPFAAVGGRARGRAVGGARSRAAEEACGDGDGTGPLERLRHYQALAGRR